MRLRALTSHGVQSKTSTECSYLDSSDQLKHAALFVSTDGAQGRAVYGLHLPPSNRSLALHLNDISSRQEAEHLPWPFEAVWLRKCIASIIQALLLV